MLASFSITHIWRMFYFSIVIHSSDFIYRHFNSFLAPEYTIHYIIVWFNIKMYFDMLMV